MSNMKKLASSLLLSTMFIPNLNVCAMEESTKPKTESKPVDSSEQSSIGDNSETGGSINLDKSTVVEFLKSAFNASVCRFLKSLGINIDTNADLDQVVQHLSKEDKDKLDKFILSDLEDPNEKKTKEMLWDSFGKETITNHYGSQKTLKDIICSAFVIKINAVTDYHSTGTVKRCMEGSTEAVLKWVISVMLNKPGVLYNYSGKEVRLNSYTIPLKAKRQKLTFLNSESAIKENESGKVLEGHVSIDKRRVPTWEMGGTARECYEKMLDGLADVVVGTYGDDFQWKWEYVGDSLTNTVRFVYYKDYCPLAEC